MMGGALAGAMSHPCYFNDCGYGYGVYYGGGGGYYGRGPVYHGGYYGRR